MRSSMTNKFRSIFLFTILSGICLFYESARARVLYQTMQTTRSAGMGNTGVTFTRGVDSLLINPAALARSEGYSFTIADVSVGVGVSSTALATGSGAGLTSSDISEFYGNKYFADVSAKTGMVIPYFGFAFYSSNYILTSFNNPVFPTFNVDFVSDYGYMIAGAIPLGPQTSLGVAGRHVKRWEAKKDLLVTDLLGASQSNLIESSANDKGTGNALDLGFLTTFNGNLKPTLGAYWRDVGHTKFSATSGSGPQQQEDNLIFGASIHHPFIFADWTHAIEYKFIRTSNENLTKKIHLGTEASWGIIDLRAGLSQGYLSYGLALDLSFIKFEAAAYSMEMGARAGDEKHDRYQASLTIQLEFDQAFKLTKDGKKRRLMQRR
jgi:hypothetical protein